MYDSGLNGNSKVSQIIVGGSWKWPFPNSWDLRELTFQTPNSSFPKPLELDKAIWSLNPDDEFIIKSSWELWRNKQDTVPWYNLVGAILVFPKSVLWFGWLSMVG